MHPPAKTSPHGHASDCFDPPRLGARAAVACNHPVAAAIGLQTLAAGGNAMDAAVAMGFAIGVAEPNGSGIGGDGYVMAYDRAKGRIEVFNGTGAAPLAASAEHGIDRLGLRSASVPGLVDAMLLAHARSGRLSLQACIAPAIALCVEGVPVSHFQAAMTAKYPQLHQDPEAARIFAPQGRPLGPGGIRRNPDLAGTYALIAREGRDAFYQGPIAQAIASHSQAAGGLLTLEDLQRHSASHEQPISSSYRGRQVYTSAPNSCGYMLLQQLNMLEQYPLADLPYLGAEALHLMAEAKRLAFIDREAYLGDPRDTDIPLAGLLSKGYAAERVQAIDAARAAQQVTAGSAWRHQQAGGAGGAGSDAGGSSPAVREKLDDTTHFCVVDKDGNAVGQLQSLNMMYGAQVVVPGTGILLNNRMAYWHLEASHPNALRPGRRVRHTMHPVMLFDGACTPGKNVRWVLGTPGGDTQSMTNLQLISAMVDHGLNEAEAVQAPRWCHHQDGTYSNHPHGETESLTLEIRHSAAAATLDQLQRMGHPVTPLDGWAARGSAGIVGVLPGSGARVAAADLRRDGQAVVM